MNSKVGRFFYLTISFIVGAFFLIVGAYSLILPWSSLIQTKTIHLILNHTLIFSLFGLGLTLSGLSILIYTILSSRRCYTYIRTGNHSIAIDETLIQQYLTTYWQEHFPQQSIPSHLAIKKNAIHIVADLPFVPQTEQKAFLEQVKQDFIHIFNRLLGYPHEIYLAASFEPSKNIS